MEASVPKLQTFFATKIVRKNHRKRGAQFSKRKAFLRKRRVRKGKRGHPPELRQILSRKTYSMVIIWDDEENLFNRDVFGMMRKTYSIVMYLGWWGKLIQSWCIWDDEENLLNRDVFGMMRKTYSIVMYLGCWGKLIQSWCIWDDEENLFSRDVFGTVYFCRLFSVVFLRKHRLILHILTLCMVKDNGRILITKSFLNF